MGKNLTYDDLEDITQDLKSELAGHKEIEAKAHQIFNEFKEVADRLRSGIYRFDIKSRKFFFFNRAASELLGARKTAARAITPQTVSTLIHPEDLEKVKQAAQDSAAADKLGGDVEYRYANRDGTYSWLYDRWVVLRDTAGHPRYFEGIVMDITERKLAEQALAESEQKLRSLSSHLLQAQEKERRRIALELHDELGQALTVLKLQIRSIRKKIAPIHNDVIEDCTRSYAYVDQIIENVRRLSHDLCPSGLEDLGLDASIRQVIKDFSDLTRINVSIDGPPVDSLFSLESKILIYRIFQEAFTNIQKHARADNVFVLIKNDTATVYFHLVDDGRGFVAQPTVKNASQNTSSRGLGLTTMSERARMMGGALKIYSIIGIGTRIAFRVPCNYKASHEKTLLHHTCG
jgi:PAS domain S-box-containing protein